MMTPLSLKSGDCTTSAWSPSSRSSRKSAKLIAGGMFSIGLDPIIRSWMMLELRRTYSGAVSFVGSSARTRVARARAPSMSSASKAATVSTSSASTVCRRTSARSCAVCRSRMRIWSSRARPLSGAIASSRCSPARASVSRPSSSSSSMRTRLPKSGTRGPVQGGRPLTRDPLRLPNSARTRSWAVSSSAWISSLGWSDCACRRSRADASGAHGSKLRPRSTSPATRSRNRAAAAVSAMSACNRSNAARAAVLSASTASARPRAASAPSRSPSASSRAAPRRFAATISSTRVASSTRRASSRSTANSRYRVRSASAGGESATASSRSAMANACSAASGRFRWLYAIPSRR